LFELLYFFLFFLVGGSVRTFHPFFKRNHNAIYLTFADKVGGSRERGGPILCDKIGDGWVIHPKLIEVEGKGAKVLRGEEGEGNEFMI
jgi:hypothetical protein